MSEASFPTTLLQAVRYFGDETVCRDFLAGLRWPNGVRCIKCDSDRVGFLATRSLWRCKDCRREFSVKKGTIFEDSPIALSKWLPAIWLYSAGKKGRSSHQLAKDLGVTQKTAWFISHRIRLAMETESFAAPLSGEVEVDETIMGGEDQNKHKQFRRGYLSEDVQRFNTRHEVDHVRFTNTAARVLGRRVTYKELTGKVGPKGAMA